MAFHQPHAAVDGNFYRVFARYFGLSQPINTPQGKQLFATMAQHYLPPHQASAYNQAIMDFGATVCTPKAPSCSACPLQETCAAFREDRVDQLPVKLRTLKVKQRQMDCFYVHCQGQIALHKRAAGDIWQGLWTVPEADHLSTSLRQQATLLKSNVKHVLTHRVIHANFYRLECHERPTLPADFIWIDEADIDHYAIPRLMEMLLESLA
jgi:A/G-specific adenine glycosylase